MFHGEEKKSVQRLTLK